MATQFFKDGIISQPVDAITPGFVQALTMGFLRYMGNARESESGAERPLRVLLCHDDTEEAEEKLRFFEEALETVGVEHGDAGSLSVPALNIAFFELKYDAGIAIYFEDDEIKIEIFECGEEIGGLEASMPGGVNYEGKARSLPYGTPLTQAGVNVIEHALNTETGFETATTELNEDLHDEAVACYVDHVENYLKKVGPISNSKDTRVETDFSRVALKLKNGEATELLKAVCDRLNVRIVDENQTLEIELGKNGKDASLFAPNGNEIKKPEIVDFIRSYLGLPEESELVKIHETGIVLPGEPIPDGLEMALLVCKILAK
jgi:hypothetical protein